MSFMWSAASFTYYEMQVFNKYLEGTIYKNAFLDSVSGIIGVSVASPLYYKYSTRITLMVSLLMMLISG